MRTTVNIHDGLLATAKQRARARGTTLGALIEEALRLHLVSTEVGAERDGPPLPVFRTGGFARGVDPSSNASLIDAVGDDDEDFAGRARDAAS